MTGAPLAREPSPNNPADSKVVRLLPSSASMLGFRWMLHSLATLAHAPVPRMLQVAAESPVPYLGSICLREFLQLLYPPPPPPTRLALSWPRRDFAWPLLFDVHCGAQAAQASPNLRAMIS